MPPPKDLRRQPSRSGATNAGVGVGRADVVVVVAIVASFAVVLNGAGIHLVVLALFGWIGAAGLRMLSHDAAGGQRDAGSWNFEPSRGCVSAANAAGLPAKL